MKKQTIERIFKRIRLTKNRDDKVKAKLLICDMGGIGKQEVYDILIDELGEDLINCSYNENEDKNENLGVKSSPKMGWGKSYGYPQGKEAIKRLRKRN